MIKWEVFGLEDNSWGGERGMVRGLYNHEQQEE